MVFSSFLHKDIVFYCRSLDQVIHQDERGIHVGAKMTARKSASVPKDDAPWFSNCEVFV